MPSSTQFHAENWGDLLDASVLAALSALDPGSHRGLVMRILRVFTQSLPKYIDQMEQARASRDTLSAKRAAHSVKSSAATVGAMFLNALSTYAERRCTEGQLWVDSTEVTTFLDECRRLHSALSERLVPAEPDTI